MTETHATPPETRKRPRRWHQFGLRALLLLVVLTALPLSWIATRRYYAARENTIIESIRRKGGQFSFYGREGILGWKMPYWLGKLTGEGPRTAQLWFPDPSDFDDDDVELLLCLDPLEALSLHNTKCSDRGMATLARHRGIKRLEFSGTIVGDAGLQQVAAMPQLTSLALCDTKITSAGVRSLGGLRNLRVLELGGPQTTDQTVANLAGLQLTWIGLHKAAVTDRSVAPLTQMPLQQAFLDGTAISDAGFRDLGTIRSLVILDVSGTRITDAGLAAIANHPRLRALDLDDTAISDQGLQHLAALANLSALNMANTAVSDEGLHHLIGLKRLNSLNLSGTAVTDTGIVQLGVLQNLGTLDVSRTNVTLPVPVRLQGPANWDHFYRTQDGFTPQILNFIP